MENKLYTLRDMNADDLFVVLKIINKIGVREVRNCFNSAEVKKAISGNDGGVNEEMTAAIGLHVMMELAGLIIEHLPECKDEIYCFLGSLSGMKAEEVAALPMGTFFDMVMDVLKHPNFNDFFQRVVGLFK